MPLIIMCGIGCAGKTTRAYELQEYLRNNGIDCCIVSEKRHETTASADEKSTRAKFHSDVARACGDARTTVVIADGMNLIKGSRYELYCRAREMNTTQCVVYCRCSLDEATQRNHTMGASRHYSDDRILKDMANRIEEPNGAKRWDKPLFVVSASDDAMPFEEITKHLVNSRPAKQSFATKPAIVNDDSKTNGSAAAVLSSYERVTRTMVNAIARAQNTRLPGDPSVCIPPATIQLLQRQHRLSMVELRDMRAQFISQISSFDAASRNSNSNNSDDGDESMANLFIQFINQSQS